MNTPASAKLQPSGAAVAIASRTPWERARAREAALLGLILGLGALLRLATLGHHSLWLDEGLSYWIANRPLDGLLDYLARRDTHPPLHYLVLQAMIALGGSEWLLRLPSALAGIGAIALLYALGKEVFDARTGLLAAFILAVSPLHLWHAQEARMYALVATLALAATLCAARALRTGRLLDWAGLIACQALALWTNTAAIWFTFALNAAALLLLVTLRRRGRLWPWLASQALAVGLWLPWLPVFLKQIQVSGSANTWIAPATFGQVALTIAGFVSQGGPRWVAWLALALLLALLAAGGRALLADARAGRERSVLLLCLLIVPVGLAFLISQPYVSIPGLALLFRPGNSIFLTRNLIVATFPLYLLLARGLILTWEAGEQRSSGAAEQRRPFVAPLLPRALAPLLLVALLALNAISYQASLLAGSQEDWRAAAALVAGQATAADAVILAPSYLQAPFAYYYARRGGAGVVRGYPHDDVAVAGETPGYATPAAAAGAARRVWLVTSPLHERNPAVDAIVASLGRPAASMPGTGILVRVYERGEEQ